MIHKVLVAEDNATDRQLMEEMLLAIDDGLEVQTARDGEKASALLDEGAFDVVLTDMRMPGKDGLQVLEKAKSACAGCEVVVITGHGEVPTAVETMKKGSFDYLLKPICLEDISWYHMD